jgi:hypothetical protein
MEDGSAPTPSNAPLPASSFVFVFCVLCGVDGIEAAPKQRSWVLAADRGWRLVIRYSEPKALQLQLQQLNHPAPARPPACAPPLPTPTTLHSPLPIAPCALCFARPPPCMLCAPRFPPTAASNPGGSVPVQ